MGLILGSKLIVQKQNICLFLVCQFVTDNVRCASKAPKTKFSNILGLKNVLNFLDLVFCGKQSHI